MQIENGWLKGVEIIASPFFDERPEGENISLLVIHNISLPPQCYGGPYITQLFTGALNADEHPYFEKIHQLKVSSHCLIRRDGELIQYVNFEKRAWHAGQSIFKGRAVCNDFSIGIELEGSDFDAFTDPQYRCLVELTCLLQKTYSITKDNIVGHSDISPGRKTDPGSFFDWKNYFSQLAF